MFIDERTLVVRSGKGGDGIVAWRREKRIARGGPAGGDGGKGGDVILIADENLTTFADMEDERHARAKNGERGSGSNKQGKNGKDREVRVPVGTTVYDVSTGMKIRDLTEHDTRWVVAKGGKGGRGNARFATATDQAPSRAELGEPGEERKIRFELRLLADVGLIGLPNAGKSTFLSRISAARPRVANYPFTTLTPCLGLVDLPDFSRFVVADLPGLIEGAHEGHGLGDRFLRHVERTRILIHLVDPVPLDGSDPVERYRTVRRELEAYGRGLAGRPEILAATKADLWAPNGRVDPDSPTGEALRRLAQEADRGVHPVSAVSGVGLPALLRTVAKALQAADPAPPVPDEWEGVRPPPDSAGVRFDSNREMHRSLVRFPCVKTF